jgi:hypothetical protein
MGSLRSGFGVVFAIAAVAGAALAGAFVLREHSAMRPPEKITVNSCRAVPSNMIRTDSDFGIALDAPSSEFAVRSASSDMPPGTRRRITSIHGSGYLLVWRDDAVLFFDLKSAFPVMSEKTGTRNVTNTLRATVGTDTWGYLEDGERWRYVTFRTGTAVGYRPLPPAQADALDQILSSACFAPLRRIE